MGKQWDSIPKSMMKFINDQKVFYVATAPLGEEGLVNLSPKGVDGSFHIVNENRVWYEDLTGSGELTCLLILSSSGVLTSGDLRPGVATIAHVRENGRITIMFNAFEGSPNILRLYGKGTIHEFGTPEYEEYLPGGERQIGSRAVVVVDVFKVTTSCGFGVPYMAYLGPRTRMITFGKVLEAGDSLFTSGLRYFWKSLNRTSIDGLPGLLTAFDSKQTFVTPNPSREIVFDEKQKEAIEKAICEIKEGDGEGRKVREVRVGGVRMEDVKIVSALFVGVVLGATYAGRLKRLVAY